MGRVGFGDRQGFEYGTTASAGLLAGTGCQIPCLGRASPAFREVLLKSMEVLAVIPARGGSKSIPRKNLVDLCGRPLVAHSIAHAQAAKSVTRTLVSTDDEEIRAVALA